MPPLTLTVDDAIFSPEWLERASAGLDDAGRTLLSSAVEWVAQPLSGKKASTGEPLDQHCARVVLILARLGSDAATRAGALLTTLPPDHAAAPVRAGTDAADTAASSAGKAGQQKNDIEAMTRVFGAEVVSLVQGTRALLRLGTITGQASDTSAHDSEQKEKQRKMLLAMAADLRIVLMRQASRLQTLNWYARSKTPCPAALARETLELYTPLANRLGIWQIKWEMEDLAFRFLEPETYKSIASQLEEKRAEREAFIADVVRILRDALQHARIAASVTGRPKHIYSIWNKMRIKNLDFNELSDLRALRVIVDDERACYAALALAHALWTPIADEFDDYISRPKPNGYRSLHTVVADDQGRHFEIQIRTHEMHEFAEYGMAAHWRYKEAGARGGEESAASRYDRKIAWMRQLLAFDSGSADSADNAASPRSAKTADRDAGAAQGASDAAERIYVMTPQARVLELPAGATPVDFAYYLHTDLGHRCRGARVDGQMVPLLTQLKTGQTVEIIAAKSGGPSRDWLNPQLGFLASPRSRAKVRAWFNAIELQQRISQGQVLVEKELQRLGKTAINLEQLAQQLGFARSDDLYVAVAKDEFSLRHIDQMLRQQSAPEAAEPVHPRTFTSGSDSVAKTGKSGVLVVGVDALLTQLARCCRPAPPDEIAGFVTRGRGVSIHRRDCTAYKALATQQPERLIEVDWGDTGQSVYPVNISIQAPDRGNLLRDLSEIFARLRLNVVGINTQSRRSLAHMVFTIEVRNGEQIRQALNALNDLAGVSATRQ